MAGVVLLEPMKLWIYIEEQIGDVIHYRCNCRCSFPLMTVLLVFFFVFCFLFRELLMSHFTKLNFILSWSFLQCVVFL